MREWPVSTKLPGSPYAASRASLRRSPPRPRPQPVRPELRDIEQQVLRHSCAYEDPPDWTADPTLDPAHPDPTRHKTTGRPLPGWQGPVLRPTLIRWLLTDPDATALLEPRGLRVWNARLTEPLDLIGCTIPARLELRYCLVEAPLLLANAGLPSLTFRNTTLQKTLDAPFLKLHGPLNLDDITAAATLNFNAATIPGEVRIADTTLTATGDALTMAGASITNDLILEPAFQSAGHLYLNGINIGGHLRLVGAILSGTTTAMTLDNATIGGDVYCAGEFRSAGEVRLVGTRIRGQFTCSAAKLTTTENSLALDNATIEGGIFLNDCFEAAGTIRLHGARIGGDLNCQGAKLTATEAALKLDATIINGNTFLNEGFEAAGEIRFLGAHIGGQLNCKGAKLTTAANSLTLDSATIDGRKVIFAQRHEKVKLAAAVVRRG